MPNLALLTHFVELDPGIQDFVVDNSVFYQISFDMEQVYYKRKVLLVDSYYYSYFVVVVLAIVGVEDCHKDLIWQSVLIYLLFLLGVYSILLVRLELLLLVIDFLLYDLPG